MISLKESLNAVRSVMGYEYKVSEPVVGMVQGIKSDIYFIHDTNEVKAVVGVPVEGGRVMFLPVNEIRERAVHIKSTEFGKRRIKSTSLIRKLAFTNARYEDIMNEVFAKDGNIRFYEYYEAVAQMYGLEDWVLTLYQRYFQC